MTTEKVSATPRSLQQWAYSALSQNANAYDRTMTAQYGLQSEGDVVEFLHSPEGVQALAEINKAFLVDQKLKEDKQLAAAEFQAAVQRMEAAMARWSLEEEAQSDSKREYILLQQIDAKLHKEITPDMAGKAAVEATVGNTVADYEKALGLNQALTEANTKEAEKLQTTRKNLVANEGKINQRYDHLDTSIQQTESNFKTLDRTGIQKEIDSLNVQIEQLREDIQRDIENDRDEEATQKLEGLVALQTQLANYQDMLSVTEGVKGQIDTRYNYYADKDGNKVDRVEDAQYVLKNSQKIEKGEDGTLYLIRSDQNLEDMGKAARANAQINFERRKEYLEVRDEKGNLRDEYRERKNIYWNANGELVDSIDDAQYIVDSRKKLVKANDKLYLIEPGENFESMSDLQKEQAHSNFTRQKSEMTVLKNVVNENRTEEVNENTKNIGRVDERIKTNQEEQTRLQNQRSTLSSGLAQARTMEQQAAAGQEITARPIPTPTPTPSTSGGSKPSVTATNIASAGGYLIQQKNILQEKIRANLAVSRDELEDMRNGFIMRGGSSIAFNRLMQTLPSSGQIPPVMMATFLRNMERLGLDSTNPAVTSIQNPLDKQDAARQAEQPTETPVLGETAASATAKEEPTDTPKGP